MSFYRNLKIRTKLIAGSMIIAMLALAVGVIGYVNVNSLITVGNSITNNDAKLQTLLYEAAIAYNHSRTYLRDICLAQNQDEVNQYVTELESARSYIDTRVEEMKTIAASMGDEGIVITNAANEFTDAVATYRDMRVGILTLAQNGDFDAATTELHGSYSITTGDAVETNLDALASTVVSNIDSSAERQTSIGEQAVVVMLVGAGLAVLVGVIVGIALAQSIAGSIKKIAGAVDKVAEGDLTYRLDINDKSDTGLLAKSYNIMATNLADVLLNVGKTASIVDDASKQVSSSSMSLAQISTEQASTVEEISASISEITSQTKANSDSANKATDLSKKTRDSAIRGNGMMSEMLGAMQAINDASANISNIIKVIEDIAFQTNILALNASVEAARAGQHGRGFAVVAEEVRNLAARSQKAASESTQMIEDSIKEVSRGTKIANDTATALKEIVEGVSESASLVESISEASSQQSQGATQINTGMEQVSSAIQTTSSVAEEAASSSAELAEQSSTLKNLLNRFKFEPDGSARQNASAAPAVSSEKTSAASGSARRQTSKAAPKANVSRPRVPSARGAFAPARQQSSEDDTVTRSAGGFTATDDFGKY